MTTVALIPARGGSKGILNKNTKLIAGKPLIAWSIEQALASKKIDEVFVSTDCDVIASIAKEYGASVPFLRPTNISGDSATTESAMIHFAEWLSSKNIFYDNMLLVQATSPIRHAYSFDDAILNFEVADADSVVTVVPSHRFFWSNPEKPQAGYDFMNRPRRQDISIEDILYMETGSFYITKIKNLLDSGCRLCGKVQMYIMQEEEAYEIDTLVDFIVCEALISEFLIGK